MIIALAVVEIKLSEYMLWPIYDRLLYIIIIMSIEVDASWHLHYIWKEGLAKVMLCDRIFC